MERRRFLTQASLLALGATVTLAAQAAKPAKAQDPPNLEPKAMEVLRAMSTALTGAQSMSFNAVTTYESPSRIGPPLQYATRSEVLMQRPDRLRVVTLGDGPAAEYYYDGKTLTAFAPAENLVAVAPAPPTIDAMLEQAFKTAAIYFPFADVVGSDPYKLISEGLNEAFYIGQSKVVDGTVTDILGLASDELFLQMWVGASDHLPRKMRAVYRGDPLRLRHEVVMTDWKLDPVIAADAFASLNASKAGKMSFAAPQAPVPGKGAKGTTKTKAAQ